MVEDVAGKIEQRRALRIDEPDVDLIAGLPGQTFASWRESLEWIERIAPPHVSISHMALRFPPVSQFVERFRALLRRRRRFDFDAEVQGLSRVEQAVAFLALLELRKEGEIAISQAAAFAPIRISRSEDTLTHSTDGRILQWTARSA